MSEEQTYKAFKAGDRIMSKGDDAAECYMIVSGKVRVFLEESTKQVELAVLGENELFGEAAIFDGEHYGANVDAIEDTKLLLITPQTLNGLLVISDPVIRALIRMLVKRLRDTNDALVKSETREFMDIGFV